jgi:hypothetical protein
VVAASVGLAVWNSWPYSVQWYQCRVQCTCYGLSDQLYTVVNVGPLKRFHFPVDGPVEIIYRVPDDVLNTLSNSLSLQSKR